MKKFPKIRPQLVNWDNRRNSSQSAFFWDALLDTHLALFLLKVFVEKLDDDDNRKYREESDDNEEA